jgi:hypothetical protein
MACALGHEVDFEQDAAGPASGADRLSGLNARR